MTGGGAPRWQNATMSSPPLQPPGWHYAQGDPQGTHRWWDGAQWVGGPVGVPGASLPPFSPPPAPAHGAPGAWAPPAYPQSGRVLYAGWWLRFGAWLLDGLIIGVPGGIINTATRELVPKKLTTCADLRGRTRLCETPTVGGWSVIVLVGLVLFAAGVAYYAYFNGTKGQSIGKQACGIKVLDHATLAPIGVGRAVGRYFGSIVSAIPCGLGFLWAAWDENKQTGHDKMVSSIVVKTNG